MKLTLVVQKKIFEKLKNWAQYDASKKLFYAGNKNVIALNWKIQF